MTHFLACASGRACPARASRRGDWLHDRRHGFSLIEMLCVMGLLTVLGGIMVVLLRETLAIDHLQDENLDRMVASNSLADQFRADVAGADSVSPALHEFRTSPATLILRMPSGAHVVYSWREQKLSRIVFADKKAEQYLPVDATRTDVEFYRSERNPKLVTMRLNARRRDTPAPGQALAITAALGGDWR
jgi:prepilin-type N-terminal cleavage/methylation domain-containing protein